MQRRTLIRTALASLAAGLQALPALAQPSWPTGKPITYLVPFPAGRDQLGTIVVSDDDTDGNGKPQHQVRVPVVLLS